MLIRKYVIAALVNVRRRDASMTSGVVAMTHGCERRRQDLKKNQYPYYINACPNKSPPPCFIYQRWSLDFFAALEVHK